MAFYSICFDRQLGSGGREISRAVAEELGFNYYDEEIVTLAAKESNLCEETVKEIDEKPTASLLYSVVTNTSHYTGSGAFGFNVPINDKLYIAQNELIKNKAENENSVFVGRCSDYILSKKQNNISVFVYGDMEHRTERIMQRHNCDEKKAAELISKTDKRRASYYSFYTGNKWGAMQNYDICVNSSLLGIEGTAKLIADIVRKCMK